MLSKGMKAETKFILSLIHFRTFRRHKQASHQIREINWASYNGGGVTFSHVHIYQTDEQYCLRIPN